MSCFLANEIKPTEVKSLYEVPNTTEWKEGDKFAEHGVHYVKMGQETYIVTHLSNGQLMWMRVTGEMAHTKIAYMQEAWGDSTYYTCNYSISFNPSPKPVLNNEIKTALSTMLNEWRGQNWNVVDIIAAAHTVIYRSYFSIGD